MKTTICKLILVINFVLFLTLCPLQAKANLTITPTRVVFEDHERFADVILVNTGQEQKTYEMGWRFFRMQETGAPYIAIDSSPTEFDLSKHVVFTPRRVTLSPGGKQKIRLALRRPQEVPPGDYHAHLEFATVQEAADSSTASKDDIDSGRKAQAAVTINVGYTIPVIFRTGDVNVTATIERIDIKRHENGKLYVTVPIHRQGGPYSALGHLYIYHQIPEAKEELVGEISNAHIFPEVTRRVYDVPLTKEDVKNGNLRVVFQHYKQSDLIYDEKIFPLK